mmetsp:Transcript_11926/g.19411  ORF Transcript_11926/g.19411 Transcript_11926/m.19411 type:complete len:220 (-) Transcript_11926:17-676(-)
MENTPSQSLYINNINEKIKKNVLKKVLHSLFSQYGKVIEIVACKGLKLRGQAWVVYQDSGSATNAMRRLQGFNLYDKPLRIAFAKSKSDIVAKKDGTFVPRQKRPREEPSSTSASKVQAVGNGNSSGKEGEGDKPKLVVNHVPHRILFAQNLPDECTVEMLTPLFQQYAGYQEVRMVPGKKGIAFIEFQDLVQAGIALQSLNGFKLSETETLHLTYGNQ